jgi:hypothetical protein
MTPHNYIPSFLVHDDDDDDDDDDNKTPWDPERFCLFFVYLYIYMCVCLALLSVGGIQSKVVQML